MFECNPKTVSYMTIVVNKHDNMEDAERAHRRHKDHRVPADRSCLKGDHQGHRSDDHPPRHGKNHDCAESSKARDRKRGPENTVVIADWPQQHSSLN